MAQRRIIKLRNARTVGDVGAKAANLHWLLQHRARIPETYVLPFGIHRAYRERGLAALDELRPELTALLDPLRPYAVRSSASVEDSRHHSFAGQFKTLLNVCGPDAVRHAVQEVLDAAQSQAASAYAEKARGDINDVALAVVIQEMVTPVISGVSFSKNPVTGLDEVVVEAVEGSGEALVQQGRTPDRWVYKWGSWITQPSATRIDLALVQQVVNETMRLEQAYGVPIDLEWVYDGRQLYIVQLRPITRLDEINIYSNRIAREVFPGLIKPLVWSVNVPLVNGAWIRLFTELIGANTLRPDELARAFAFRCYFNMGVIGRIFTLLGFPRESLELLMGLEGGAKRPRFRPSLTTLKHLPRMLAFAVRMPVLDRRLARDLIAIRAEQAGLVTTDLATLDDTTLFAQIDSLYDTVQKTAYFNIVVPLLMRLYDRLLQRQLSRIGVDDAMFDATNGLAELRNYDPNLHLRALAAEYNRLDEPGRTAVEAATAASDVSAVAAFRSALADYLQRFGHLSDSGNDFSSSPWRENPALVLQMVRAEAMHQAQAAGNAEPAPAGSKLTWESLQLGVLRRMRIGPIYRRARRYRLHREEISSAYTYGYGLFRIYFLELGRRLVSRGVLPEPDSIFYLYLNEVREYVLGTAFSSEDGSLAARAMARRAEMDASRELTLPDVIYGDQPPPLRDPGKIDGILKGIPSSRGYYRGPARVITSVTEFESLNAGDVLIIPFSDVSWTPLFTRAGAIIAESGGVLSHSSIVAREFNLPCIVSTPNACRIPNGTQVTVDGFKGEVYLHAAP